MRKPAVLVVDDDFIVRLHASDVLQEAGFDVVQAGDAVKALDILQELPCLQLICTDVQMPGEIDGIDLVQCVRERYPETKVIIMSAHSRHSERLPSVPFLSKPFRESHLVDLARKALSA